MKQTDFSTYKKTGITMISRTKKEDFIDFSGLDYRYEDYRGLTKQTCQELGISIARFGEVLITRYIHTNLDQTQNTKYGIRPKKRFIWDKPTSHTNMFNLNMCRDLTRPLHITEGNEDAATLYQLGYQACSLHSATTVEENLKTDLQQLLSYPEIILCLDNDVYGKEAKQKLKNQLSMKLLKEVHLELKDVNQYLQEDRQDELKILLEKPIEIVPEGLIFGDQIDSDILRAPMPAGLPLPFPKMQDCISGGLLRGDLVLFTAGVSIGKSTVLRKFCHFYKNLGYKVGNIFVEENKKVSQLNYICEDLGYPIGDVLLDPTVIPKDEWDESFKRNFDKDVMFIDEFWERSAENLLRTIKYLTNVKKYDIILLDHITAIINASGVSRSGKVHDIDWLMEELHKLCQQTGVILLVVSHLKRPSQPPYWDEGRRPSMYDLRGSGSLEGKPDIILSMSRNMKDPSKIDTLQLEVLKNRWFSTLGDVDTLYYIKSTGRLEG